MKAVLGVLHNHAVKLHAGEADHSNPSSLLLASHSERLSPGVGAAAGHPANSARGGAVQPVAGAAAEGHVPRAVRRGVLGHLRDLQAPAGSTGPGGLPLTPGIRPLLGLCTDAHVRATLDQCGVAA